MNKLELVIMYAIRNLQATDQAYGTGIIEYLDKLHVPPVTVGAMYATLPRLEEKGWIKGIDVAGKRRKKRLYHLTAEGVKVICGLESLLERFNADMQKIVDNVE